MIIASLQEEAQQNLSTLVTHMMNRDLLKTLGKLDVQPNFWRKLGIEQTEIVSKL